MSNSDWPKLNRLESNPRSLILAGVSGVGMALATAPLNWFWLAWVALVPLWVITCQRSGRSRLPAVLWGVGYHGLALSWIHGLHPLTWMGVPWLASVVIVTVCWLIITGLGVAAVVLWSWGLAWLDRRSPMTPGLRILTGTALWCGIDWLWSQGALYWTALSYTQSPGNPVILHLGQLSGSWTVIAAIVAINGCLAEAWLSYQQSRKTSRHWVIRAVGLLILCYAIGGWLYSHSWQPEIDQPLKLGIVQGNVPTRMKLSNDGIRRALSGYTNGYTSLALQGVDAVLTPEGALPMIWDGQNPIAEAVADRQVPLWLGTFVREDQGISQNLLTVMGNSGLGNRYRKSKLVPLGEYIPFQEVLNGWIGRLSPLRYDMIPGDPSQRLDTPFGRAIVSICYESAFPEIFRAQAADGGLFILTASNLDPYSEVLMAQQEAQDLMRAIETDRWAVRATNTGYSGVINPRGQILWRSSPHTYQLHIATIQPRYSQTLYVRWGNWLTPLLLGLSSTIYLRQAWRR